eukprot:c21646_g1_i3.p1 GENE.c21646_g1_i3~~c21646_g1_i3.p1  ORF type:complete len:1154 (-),score=502.59 c21646_g1_i3:167-3628(-)
MDRMTDGMMESETDKEAPTRIFSPDHLELSRESISESDASRVHVQFYLPGGASMKSSFSWKSPVSELKHELYSEALEAATLAGIELKDIGDYNLKVSSRLPNDFTGSRVIDDNVRLEEVECLKYCHQRRIIARIALVKKEKNSVTLAEQSETGQEPTKPAQTPEQQLEELITALVGVDFSEINDHEISKFKQAMKQFRAEEFRKRSESILDVRDVLRYHFTVSLTNPVALDENESVFLRVRLNVLQESSKVLPVALNESADETIRNACAKFNISRIKMDARQFVLKVTHFEEFIFGDQPTVSFDCVASQLKKKQQVDLTLWDIEKLLEPILQDCPWAAVFSEEFGRKYYYNTQSGESVWEDPRLAWLRDTHGRRAEEAVQESAGIDEKETGKKKNSKFRKFSSLQAPILNGVHVVNDLPDLDETSTDETQEISLNTLHRYFRIRCVGCDNLFPSKAYPSYCSKFDDQNCEIWVEISLCFGGEQLCKPQKTQMTQLCAFPRWNEWVSYDISLRDLPVGAKLCVTIWGEGGGKKIPFAWTNIALMDKQNHLRQGICSHRMFPDDCAHPFGTCSENYTDSSAPILFMEFESYPVALCFPTGKEKLIHGFEIEKSRKEKNVKLPEFTNEEKEKVTKAIQKHPLASLDEEEKKLLWKGRYELIKDPKALPKILRSVQWANHEAVAETVLLLSRWVKPPPLDALELLSAKFSDPEVRKFGVECLEGLSDAEVIDLLPQLVQVLKSELHLDSALARFLLSRGLRNPFKVGHNLFWLLKAEMHVPESSQRFGLLLQEFLKGCSTEYCKKLSVESETLETLFQVSINVTTVNEKEKRNEYARECLRSLQLPKSFCLPLGPQWCASGLVYENCRAMDSKKVPLWLTFTNSDPQGPPLVAMLKYGDDLRQDIVTLQMIRIMDKLWEAQGLQLRMNTYNVVATGDMMGMLEIVPNAVTYAKITKEAGGAIEVFNKQRVKEWITKTNPGKQSLAAIDNLIRSMAGYCVATYVLGIGDRHDDNIMFTHQGHLFHIDFGHFLGHFKDFKKIPGVKIRRERTPFVFTPDWAVAIGGLHSDGFNSFVDLCCKAYLVLRKNANLFINMFAMMLSTGIPELEDEEDIQYMIDVLKLDVSDDEATSQLKKLILYSHNNFFKQVDGYFHIATRK